MKAGPVCVYLFVFDHSSSDQRAGVDGAAPDLKGLTEMDI